MEGPYSYKAMSAPLPVTVRHSVRTTYPFAMAQQEGGQPRVSFFLPLSASPRPQDGVPATSFFYANHQLYTRSQCVGAKFSIKMMVEPIDDLDLTPVLDDLNGPCAVFRAGLMSVEQFNQLEIETVADFLQTSPHSEVRVLSPANMFAQQIDGSIDLASWLAGKRIPMVDNDLSQDPRDGGLSNTSQFDLDGDVIIELAVADCLPIIVMLLSGFSVDFFARLKVLLTVEQDWVYTQLHSGSYPIIRGPTFAKKQQIKAKLEERPPVKKTFLTEKSLSFLDRLKAMFI